MSIGMYTGILAVTLWTMSLSAGSGYSTSMVMPSIISTILTDLYMIWCCWMVWEWCWLVVLPPILFLIAATVSKIIATYDSYIYAPFPIFLTLYTSFILATTLWCTLFIIYYILSVTGVNCGAGMLYLDTIVGIAKGVAPTLIIGQAAVGHTHPDERDGIQQGQLDELVVVVEKYIGVQDETLN
ncbi:hypothetical protein ARMGADRAFT_1029321 [Armillaria gallica]|uniref:Uncharacterized protein n=1 Tax=Armillaria gallica TaxID=47427 RepID=A0A2H3E0W9_ARMGA|nr:hypothetical protein ARMGADRAFT_1029321 [Armillaria gallica]